MQADRLGIEAIGRLAPLVVRTTSFAGAPLPIDLSPIGATGCSILINHGLLLPGLTAGSGSGGGSASFHLPIPFDPTLRGLKLFFQAYVLDAAANSFGLTSTGGLEVKIQ